MDVDGHAVTVTVASHGGGRLFRNKLDFHNYVISYLLHRKSTASRIG